MNPSFLYSSIECKNGSGNVKSAESFNVQSDREELPTLETPPSRESRPDANCLGEKLASAGLLVTSQKQVQQEFPSETAENPHGHEIENFDATPQSFNPHAGFNSTAELNNNTVCSTPKPLAAKATKQ